MSLEYLGAALRLMCFVEVSGRRRRRRWRLSKGKRKRGSRIVTGIISKFFNATVPVVVDSEVDIVKVPFQFYIGFPETSLSKRVAIQILFVSDFNLVVLFEVIESSVNRTGEGGVVRVRDKG